MFFDDEDLAPKQKRPKALPPIPDTGWTPPTQMPDLTGASVIAFDLETKEPDFDHGPGWGRGLGHIIGISVAAIHQSGDRFTAYYPIRHEVCPEQNLPADKVLAWAKRQLETPNIPKVGANLIYDIGWLTTEGIYVEGELHDAQFAEALLYEDEKVALEILGQKYVGEGKDSGIMYQWIRDAYKPKKNAERGELWRTPPSLVGYYAESDADLPLAILEKQWPLLLEQQLDFLYRVECDLIYLWVRMRLAGVTVDLNKAEEMQRKLEQEIAVGYGKLARMAGRMLTSVNSPDQLAPIFDAAGVKYPKTPTGKPSFTKDWLEACDHPVAAEINHVRNLEKFKSTFIENAILNSHVDGKIYGSFHPLRSDSGGTRSGRLSSSEPNLQQVPARTDLGKEIREMFIPDYGHMCWEINDYSQIEYRFLAHFAVGEGADAVRQQYIDDPNTDYHDHTQWLVQQATGKEIDRTPIKNINFGLLYGMGLYKLMRQMNIGESEGRDTIEAYHGGAPYVKATMAAAANEAEQLGYITTICGRRSRFNLWEPHDGNGMPLTYDAAINNYGSQIKRAYTYRAINRRLQGSAADQMKIFYWKCMKAGVFNVIGVPRLTVHDETNNSVPDDSPEIREGFKEMRYLMRDAIDLRIPVKIDTGRGVNWRDSDRDENKIDMEGAPKPVEK